MLRSKIPVFSFISLLLMTSACQEKKNTDGQEGTAPETQVSSPEMPSYPALGNEALSRLYADAEKVDIIFYNLPISVNQDDEASAKNTVLYVSPASPNITKACQPLGRLTWVSKGAILREADIYCDSGCQYLLFMENNKPMAANAMVPAGVDFFNNIISQVSKPKE